MVVTRLNYNISQLTKYAAAIFITFTTPSTATAHCPSDERQRQTVVGYLQSKLCDFYNFYFHSSRFLLLASRLAEFHVTFRAKSIHLPTNEKLILLPQMFQLILPNS